VELFPLGAFTKDGTNFEGDIVRGSKPKLIFLGAFHRNVKARLSQGVFGNDLFEKRNMESILLDGMFKYNGWSFMPTFIN
jgi:phosphate-selective porin OprO and OprP